MHAAYLSNITCSVGGKSQWEIVKGNRTSPIFGFSVAPAGTSCHTKRTTCARCLLRQICNDLESTRAQRPAGCVCAHAGDGRPYLAQGSSM